MNHQEVDAWWGGYSIRTVLPGLALCVLVSIAILVVMQLVEPSALDRTISVTLLVLFWIGMALDWGYHLFGLNYRLTTRRLFRARGLLRRKLQEVDLAQITAVIVTQGLWQKLLKVGQIRVLTPSGPARAVILDGVYTPEHVADRIQALSRAAKAAGDAQQGATP